MRNHSYENDFDLHENETACRTHFHMKGFALGLVLKQRHRRLGNGPLVYQNFVERKLTVSAGKCTLARIKKLTEIFLKTQLNGPY